MEFWIMHPGARNPVSLRRKIVFEVADWLIGRLDHWHAWAVYCDRDDWKDIPF